MSDVKIKGQAPAQTTDAEYREVKVGAQGELSVYSASAPLSLRMDDTSTAGALYVGKAAIGTATSAAKWQIQKVTDTGITWAAGTSAFTNVWDNRAGLSYS